MSKSYTVLMVDDDLDDQLLTKLAFERISAHYTVQVASDGQECLTSLQTNPVLPNLILLDLNMPLMSGFEVLHLLKQSTGYRHIPVVILTTSDDPGDAQKAYDLGASSYLTKPCTHQGLARLAENVHACWFEIALIPANQPNELV